MDFGKIVKIRYENFVAKNIENLTELIKKYALKDCNLEGQVNRILDLSDGYASRSRHYENQRFTSPQPQRSTVPNI